MNISSFAKFLGAGKNRGGTAVKTGTTTRTRNASDVQFAHVLYSGNDEHDVPAIEAARGIMQQQMALVPAGEAVLTSSEFVQSEYVDQESSGRSYVETVEPFYIDRFTVTNHDYAAFVEDGGYGMMEYWPAAIQPYVMQFVDKSGLPGPQFWQDGSFDSTLASHPVVGVCWFEAFAFALWSGRQLPTAAQWQHAGTWSNTNSSDQGQMRYPWGNSYKKKHANIWRSRIGSTVAVDDFYDGCTPNGVFQLSGNVWEWVTNRFQTTGADPQSNLRNAMGEIRGGAFDTYFDSQATCLFRTGQPLMHRGANVGFRCCLPVPE